jgi:hypothetical protein
VDFGCLSLGLGAKNVNGLSSLAGAIFSSSIPINGGGAPQGSK